MRSSTWKHPIIHRNLWNVSHSDDRVILVMIRDAKIDGMVSWFSFFVRRVYSIVKPATQMPLRNLSQPLQRDQLWACGCKWVEFWIFWSILWYLHVQSCPGQFQHVKTRKPFHKTRYVKCTKVHFVTVGLLDCWTFCLLHPFASFYFWKGCFELDCLCAKLLSHAGGSFDILHIAAVV